MSPKERLARRHQRRTMAPRTPIVRPDQWSVIVLTAVAIVAGIVALALVFLR